MHTQTFTPITALTPMPEDSITIEEIRELSKSLEFSEALKKLAPFFPGSGLTHGIQKPTSGVFTNYAEGCIQVICLNTHTPEFFKNHKSRVKLTLDYNGRSVTVPLQLEFHEEDHNRL